MVILRNAILILAVAIGISVGAAAKAAPPQMHGLANSNAIVIQNQVRFTVLTPELIRMEWSPDSHFVDEPSQVFIDRALPVPQFSITTRTGQLIIQTAALRLTYRLGGGRFSSSNLKITSRGGTPAFNWRPGDAEASNLRGTVRTLDQYSGDVRLGTGEKLNLGQGLLSRDGWHVVDDSTSFLFDDSPWPWAKRRSCTGCQDLYFFGYGHQYEKALGDFAKVAGREPMPPRFAFGYWWSRYWNYSDQEMRDLVADFDRYRIPLDVLVIDMDWHRTDGLSWDERYAKRDAFGESVGWTGYSWNRSLFPEPSRFLGWLHDQELKTTVNLHPASGIPATEESYASFAKAMGITNGTPVPFEIADKRFATNLFDLTLNALARQGVDFWWLDWQQWPDSKLLPGLSNTWWLNYVFYTQAQRTGVHRAMIYHRWGGLGNHRYQIGFSGDSVISWESLAYQPYFTSTASNVLYGYWSHDIGGHMFPDGTPEDQRRIDPELYVRWMQFGGYSPILRTHSSKEAWLRKEPWRFAPNVVDALREVVERRYAMAPYIYTAAREAYDSGVSLLRPLYYAWPEEAQAYRSPGEYMFGDDMLVAPVTRPMDRASSLADVSIWLPPGLWYDDNRGEVIDGGRTITRDYALDEVPVFIRAGAVVPMNPPSVRKLQDMDNSQLILRLTPGGRSKSRVYTDAGDSEDYRGKQYAFTLISAARDARRATITVGARDGHYLGMPVAMQMVVELPAAAMPERVVVDGATYMRSDDGHPGTWSYDGATLTARVAIPSRSANTPLTVEVDFAASNIALDGLFYRMKRASAAVAWLKDHWPPPEPLPDDVALAGQLGRMIDYHPDQLLSLAAQFDESLKRIASAVDASHASLQTKMTFDAIIRRIRSS